LKAAANSLMEDKSQNESKPRWKRLLYPLVAGLLLGAGGFHVMMTGYGVLFHYLWVFILPFVLVISLLFRPHSLQAYLVGLGLITVIAAVLTSLGLGLLIVKKRSVCSDLNPIISELEDYRKANGTYPPDLSAVRRPGHLKIGEGQTTGEGINLEGCSDYDAVFYLSPDEFLCIVPITKVLPMSFTRVYVYRWSTGQPRWTSEELIWSLSVSEETQDK
jgi:hypothetical protein